VVDEFGEDGRVRLSLKLGRVVRADLPERLQRREAHAAVSVVDKGDDLTEKQSRAERRKQQRRQKNKDQWKAKATAKQMR
jgi:hypothetical protein